MGRTNGRSPNRRGARKDMGQAREASVTGTLDYPFVPRQPVCSLLRIAAGILTNYFRVFLWNALGVPVRLFSSSVHEPT
jgi:hypothetical protein